MEPGAVSRRETPSSSRRRIGNVTSAAIWRRLEPLLPEIVSALKNGERLIEIRSGAL
jgi:hypothetical protein